MNPERGEGYDTCLCGHERQWHGSAGHGGCEHDEHCLCEGFRLPPAPNPEREDSEARKSVALLLHDAYLWTEQTAVDATARGVFASGLKLLIVDKPITLADERDLLKSLLAAGWDIAPASTGEVPDA